MPAAAMLMPSLANQYAARLHIENDSGWHTGTRSTCPACASFLEDLAATVRRHTSKQRCDRCGCVLRPFVELGMCFECQAK